jgi:hypothetical protein
MGSFGNVRKTAGAWLLVMAASGAAAQFYPGGRAPQLGPLFDQGVARYQTPQLSLVLMRASGTVAEQNAKQPAGPSGARRESRDYDFTPSDLLAERSVDGYFHLGDLSLRLRREGETEWSGYSTALERHPVVSLPVEPGELQRDNLAPTLPADIPLQVTRSWAVVDGAWSLCGSAGKSKCQRAPGNCPERHSKGD